MNLTTNKFVIPRQWRWNWDDCNKKFCEPVWTYSLSNKIFFFACVHVQTCTRKATPISTLTANVRKERTTQQIRIIGRRSGPEIWESRQVHNTLGSSERDRDLRTNYIDTECMSRS